MRRSAARRRALFVALLGAACVVGAPARRATADEADDLFAAATRASAAGKPAEAIADLEAMADRGIVDATVSFDRGVAYAERARLAEQPGDLGRAAQGFEEARELTTDRAIAADATRALLLIRAEVARRRARSSEPTIVDSGGALGAAVVGALPEDAWAVLAAIASVVVGAGLFVRWLASERRARLAGTIAVALAAPLGVAFAALTAAAQDDRLHHQEAVVVAANVRPSDDRHLPIAGAAPLPEAARVDLAGDAGGWTKIRAGATVGWVPSSALRTIARPPRS